jgi:Aspartyl protease
VPRPFCLDTGLGGGPVVSQRLAEKLHLQPQGTTKIGDPSGKGTLEVPLVRLAQLSVGEVVRTDVEAAVQPDSPLLEACDGVIGLSFFRDYLVTIDLRSQQLRIDRGKLSTTDDGVLPYTLDHGIPRVDMLLDGASLPVQIDTMGPGLNIPNALASKLKFAEPPRIVGMARTVSGSFEVRGGVVTNILSLGPYKFHQPFVEITSRFQTASLGLAFLHHFSITFDQNSQLVRFNSPERDIHVAPPQMRPPETPPHA